MTRHVLLFPGEPVAAEHRAASLLSGIRCFQQVETLKSWVGMCLGERELWIPAPEQK